jgi:hypothetical protein
LFVPPSKEIAVADRYNFGVCPLMSLAAYVSEWLYYTTILPGAKILYKIKI